MHLKKLALIITAMTLMTSCAGWQASETAKSSSICEPTLTARQDHAAALVSLGRTDVERNAKLTGATALGGIAAGCGEAPQ